MLKNRKTGKNPVFIGPTFIHQNRKQDTYYYVASQEKNSGWHRGSKCHWYRWWGGSFVCISIVHLLCQIHKRDNITRKLWFLSVNESDGRRIIGDIFGHKKEEENYPGLIESKDASDLSCNCTSCKSRGIQSICPEFSPWFSKKWSRPIVYISDHLIALLLVLEILPGLSLLTTMNH